MKKATLPGIIILLGFLAQALTAGLAQAEGWESLQGPVGAMAAAEGRTREGMSSAPPVYSQGQVTINGTWGCNLDYGTQRPQEDATTDFAWIIETDVIRYLDPRHGAKFHLIGAVDFASIQYSDLKGYSYSTGRINGSNNASNQIPQGTVVAAVTNEGRYCKFRVDTYGQNLTLTWLTYVREYSIHLPVVLRKYP